MIIFWIIFALILSGGIVLFFGAPYLPTLKKQQEMALDMLNLKPGQVVYDLGCGDGRFLVAAAKRGIKGVGYELNPFVAIIAWINTRRYSKQIKIKWGNFWQADITGADGIYVFLLDRFMTRLDQKVSTEKTHPVVLVSHAFKIPDKKIDQKNGALLLYKY